MMRLRLVLSFTRYNRWFTNRNNNNTELPARAMGSVHTNTRMCVYGQW